MPVEFVCDGCGKREPGFANERGDWFKPTHWYQRTHEGKTEVACSRECIEKIGGAVSGTWCWVSGGRRAQGSA